MKTCLSKYIDAFDVRKIAGVPSCHGEKGAGAALGNMGPKLIEGRATVGTH